MMKIIKLTNPEDGGEICVNMVHFVCFFPGIRDDITYIDCGKEYIEVRETPEEIMEKIREVQ